LGKTPQFDLLTDEGRKAVWLIDVRTSHKPNPQLLGSAVGIKVMEDVPYIIGLDKYFDVTDLKKNYDYLKDFGAATASNGAVGLYHIDNITPEAQAQGRELLKSRYQTYIIDDQELRRIYQSYPNIWKQSDQVPKKCFIGCPHLSLDQIYWWTDHLTAILGQKKVAIETVLLTAPDIVTKFKRDKINYQKLLKTGAKISKTCPLMYMNNPLCSHIPIVTNSNKLRTYSSARFFEDEILLEIIKTGKIPIIEVNK
jgi:predicted aconitase